LKLNNICQKFRQHLSCGGLFYAFWRAVKYLVFIMHKPKDMQQENFIESGPLRVVVISSGLQVFWLNKQVTVGTGLNFAVNTLGLWTDSSKAKWQLIEKHKNSFKLQIIFDDIPLIQLWNIKIDDQAGLIWEIESQNTEWMYINEFRVVLLLSPGYTSWFCGYQQGNFCRFEKEWREFKVNQPFSLLAGVRFPREGADLPVLSFEVTDEASRVLIQNSSVKENMRVIGFSIVCPDDKSNFSAGTVQGFKTAMQIFEQASILDSKIELLRQEALDALFRKKSILRINKHLKILLVNLPWHVNGVWGVRAGSRWPHTKDRSEGKYIPFPFFLAQATSLLQKNKVDTQMIDAIAEQSTEEEFMGLLLSKNVDYLVAETSVPSFKQDMEILSKISEAGIKIILCGPNSLIYQASFMNQYMFVDFVLKGEYEFTLLDLVKSLENQSDFSQVPGVLYNNGKEFLSTSERKLSDINSLPWPHRESLPMDKYWDLPGDIPYPSAQMLASRGCPFNCSFCLWPQVMYQGGSYRVRDVEDVVDEMEYLVKKMKFKSIYFDDDTFNLGKDRMFKLCRTIQERGLNNIPWAIMARADAMDEDMLLEMKKSGLAAVKYGVESFEPELISSCQKGLDINKAEKMIRLTKKLGIKVHLTFTFGFSGETQKTIRRTIDRGINLDPDSVQFSILTPFPGTRLFAELDKQGRILTKDWSRYDGHSSCVFKPENLSVKDLEDAKRRAYHIWYDAKRKKRGLLGDFIRFTKYLNERGLFFVIGKTFDYLKFVWFKRKQYLNG